MDGTNLISIFLAFFIVAVSPGPATLAVSTVAAGSGRLAGISIGAGLGIGLAFWGVIAATGLGALLQATTQALFAIKIAGGCYLLWLAYCAARSAFEPGAQHADKSEEAPARPGKWFLRGLILNLSNPKAVVAWMAALSMGLRPEDGLATVAGATIGCSLIGFAIYAAYAAVFSHGSIMQGYARVRRWIDASVAGLFAVAGLALLRSAFQRGPDLP